ncbi:MAG: phage holin family protein [Bacilli bacterium]|nr:phage holin family protein [Bacilli bacterium]
MDIVGYITDSRTILIPALYIIGYIIKTSTLIKNKYIPLILLAISIIFSIFMGGDSITYSIIQGILAAGATVMTDQLIKQSRKSQ